MPGIELPSGHGTLYAYQTYRNYGGYDLAWCGRLTDDTGEVMDGMRVYVQGALVPDQCGHQVQGAPSRRHRGTPPDLPVGLRPHPPQ